MVVELAEDGKLNDNININYTFIMKRILLMLTLALVALAGCKKDPAPEPIAVTSVSLDKTEVGLIVGESANVKAIVKPDDAANKEVKWTVANTSIATVDEGEVTAVAVGETTLIVTTVDGGHTATIPVKVTAKAVKVSQIKLVGMPTTDFKVGRSVTISAVITPDDATDKSVTFTSSNPEVATVEYTKSENNYSLALLKPVGPGKATITATANDGSGVKAEAEVDVLPAPKMVSDISITMSKSEVKVGYMVRATATVSPEDAENREVTWRSSNTAIAIVRVVDVKNNAADVIGVSPGRVIITATAKDGSGVTASVPVTVIPDKTTFASPANCYIVTTADTYAFKAVKGNSSESVGNIASVEVLWESFGTHNTPNVGELVKNVSYSNGEITFTATHMKGNAVIAAKDALGEILWSWHIWLTDQPQEQEYYNNPGVMMDRNLGATSATPGYVGSLGLLYQWGRKDPFLASSSISSPVEAKSTITWPKPVLSDSSTGKIYYTISNPTTFIYVNYLNNKNSDWYYTGSESTDNTRWTPSNRAKSIYDPCPAGWRVPDGGENGVWSKALGSSSDFRNDSLFDQIDKGMNLQGRLGSNQKIIWYPASGCRYYTNGDLYVGDSGSCWSTSPADYRAYSMNINAYGIYPSSSSSRAFGDSVRCIKE